MNEIYHAGLKEILPSSISSDEEVQRTAKAIEENMNMASRLIPLAAVYARIDELPESVLDALAWQFHMDVYDDAAGTEEKRAAVKAAVQYHRYKGTVWALKTAVASIAPQCQVLEWFDYKGKPYHFKLSTDDVIDSTEAWRSLVQTIKDAKNVRSWLDGIQYRSDVIYKMFIAQSTHDEEHLSQEIETIKTGNTQLAFGILAEITKLVEIHGAPYEDKLGLEEACFACGGVVEREVLHGA